MNIGLSNNQRMVLKFIAERLATGPAPSMAEIKHHFGYASQNSAQLHVDALERKGYIVRTRGAARSIALPPARFNDTNLWELFPQLMKGKRRGSTRI